MRSSSRHSARRAEGLKLTHGDVQSSQAWFRIDACPIVPADHDGAGMLASMPDAGDLDRASQCSAPWPIATSFFGTIPSSFESFDIESLAEQFDRFDRSGTVVKPHPG